jgi:hypothetical protein
MILETSNGTETEATAARIRELIGNDQERGDFIILSQEDELYLQTTGRDDVFITEYRDGSADRHFVSKQPLTAEQLEEVMVRYLNQDPDWKETCEWQPLSNNLDGGSETTSSYSPK